MSIDLKEPLTLPCGATLPNRLVKAAMSEALGTRDNRMTQGLVNVYKRWAAGGIGLNITGNVMIDRRARAEPGNIVIEDERDLPLLQEWAKAGQSNGGKIWVQINHPGKQCPKAMNKETVAPSAIPFRKDLQMMFGTPRELTEDEIYDIIARWGNAARIFKKAGFDGIQIHGAHGYLISQFLSPHHNQRTDQWGGSPENRRRFVLAVYDEVRRQVGPEFPVGIKLNSADFQKGGFSEEESLAVIETLEARGIDLVEVSGGTYEAPAMTGATGSKKESTKKREAYFLDFAEKVRETLKMPLMLTGGFRSVGGMKEALNSGAVDLIGLARSVAIEPDSPNRLLSDQEPRYPVKPLITGIKGVDKSGLLEIQWYTRQIKRMAKGRDPVPNEHPWIMLLMYLFESGWDLFKERKMRA
ncbi:MAG: NADH:flavin oxidoreductase/NADH oxidase family protein [Limnobacter sp.]|nr:NADH:flavin oxidoreductase/NADH oxidase family protein [Limnobacter sp.]